MDNQARPSTKRVCPDDALQKLANASAAKMPKRKTADGLLPVDDALLSHVRRQLPSPSIRVSPHSPAVWSSLASDGWTLRELSGHANRSWRRRRMSGCAM
jgi:hypothetical protein